MQKNNFEKVIEGLHNKVDNTKGRFRTKAIACFDLSGSTYMKLEEGHTVGTRKALLHNLICKAIVTSNHGKVFKELGDGVLATFDDALDACYAAVAIKVWTQKLNITSKAGLTIGEVEELEIDKTIDFLGNTIDRCARIESAAMPGQTLIDQPLHAAVSSVLKANPQIVISRPRMINARNIGLISVYELSTPSFGMSPCEIIPFKMHEEGRLSVDQKITFIENAKQSVIEIGIGLTTFTDYFVARRKTEFKDYIVKLLERGVVIKCMLLDPNCSVAKEYVRDIEEPNLLREIKESITKLKNQQKEFKEMNLRGSFEIRRYRHMPYFHAVCVDPETNLGRMSVSHYLHGVSRADAPVMQFSLALNKTIFAKYWESIKEILNQSVQVQAN